MRKLNLLMRYILKVFMLSILPLSVYAHTGLESLAGMAEGFSHPFLGFDHLLVMIAIGLWAVISGGYRQWLLPALFLLAMLVGAILSFSGFDINEMEYWVAFSVLCLGFILSQSKELSIFIAGSLVVVFALGHGYIHAAEIGSGANAENYAIGFLIATAILHGIGMVAGVFGYSILKTIKNMFGLICTLAGIALLVGI